VDDVARLALLAGRLGDDTEVPYCPTDPASGAPKPLGVCNQHGSLITFAPRIRLSIGRFSMRARSRGGGCRQA